MQLSYANQVDVKFLLMLLAGALKWRLSTLCETTLHIYVGLNLISKTMQVARSPQQEVLTGSWADTRQTHEDDVPQIKVEHRKLNSQI